MFKICYDHPRLCMSTAKRQSSSPSFSSCYVVCVILAGQIGASLPFFGPRPPSPALRSAFVHGCFVGVGRVGDGPGCRHVAARPPPLQLARFLMIREEKWTGKLRKKENGNSGQITGKVRQRERERERESILLPPFHMSGIN